MLREQNKKIASAESCTGGLLADKLTDISGSSSYFVGGVVSYSNESKVNFLGVSPKILERFGAVSASCAKQMASGIRRVTNSDIGISTTGISGPTGDTAWKPLGLVYIGYADKNICFAEKFVFQTTRRDHKLKSVDAALGLLRKKLESFR